jgi:hypothetical protein
MKPEDREPFAQGMLVLAAAIQGELSAAALDRHWSILRRYPWPLVEQGLQLALCRRWVAFPKPNELAALIEEAMVQTAERRWIQLQEAVREVGPHHSIRCADPALGEAIRILFAEWPEACRRLRAAEGAERTMLRKDFMQAYPLAWERVPSPTQGYLKGLRELWQERGLNEAPLPVIEVGEIDKPRALAVLGGSPVQAHPPDAEVDAGEPIPAEHARALLHALADQLSLPGTLSRRSRPRLPPALLEGEPPQRLEAARARREAQVRQARDAGVLE